MSLQEIMKFAIGRHYEENYYAMIGCYLDESVDPKKEGIFATGGIIGHGLPLFELERQWEILRKRPEIDIEYFKASECHRGKGQFSKFIANPGAITGEERIKLDEIWGKFIDIMIGDTSESGVIFGIGVIKEDFYEVIKDDKARSILGESPYWFAYQAAMIEAAFAMKKLKYSNVVSFVCDEDEEHSPLANDVYLELKKKNPNAAQYMATFSSASDRRCEQLQAADAAVYEIRRALRTSLGRWKDAERQDLLRWQFRKLEKRIWLIQYADREYLERVVRGNNPGEPLNLDHFMEQEFNKDIGF